MFLMFLLFPIWLTLILLVLGWALAGLPGVVAGLLLSAASLVAAYRQSVRLPLRLCNAIPLEDSRVRRMAEYFSHEARMPAPELFLCDLKGPNSFPAGTPKKSAIVLTRDALELEKNELRAVLARGIAQIRSGNALASGMSAVIGFAASWPARRLYSRIYQSPPVKKRHVILITLLALPAAFLVKLGAPRKRQMDADWQGSLLTKRPEAMASVLRKACAPSNEPWPAAMSHLWMCSPLRQGWFDSLFNAHPGVQQRLERLEVIRVAE